MPHIIPLPPNCNPKPYQTPHKRVDKSRFFRHIREHYCLTPIPQNQRPKTRMHKLHLYMLRQIMVSALFTTAVIACVIFLIRSLKLLKLVINQGIPFGEYIQMAITMLPNSVAMILPITVGIATISTYNRLIQESELVAMQGAGFTPTDLARPALYGGIITMLIGTLLYAYVMPISFKDYRERYTDARVKYVTGLIREGQFATLSSDMTFFVRERNANGQMKKIMLNDRRNAKLETTIFANTGTIIATDTGAVFQLNNGFQQYFQGDKLHIVNFDSYQIQFTATAPDARRTNAYELTLPQLATVLWAGDIKTLENPDKARSIFHQMLTTPILALTLSLLGAWMLIRVPFSRYGLGKTLLKISGALTLFIIVNFALKPLSYKHDWAIPLMYMVAYSPPVVLWWLLMRGSHNQNTPNQKIGGES